MVFDRLFYFASGARWARFLLLPLLSLSLIGPSLAQTYEVWKAAEFTPAEQADESVSGLLADPKNDGLTNLLRYGLGLSLTERPENGILTILEGAPPMQVEFTHPIGLNDLTYSVVFSSGFSAPEDWTPGVLTAGAIDGDMQTFSATDPVGGPFRFARLVITHSSGVSTSPASNLSATATGPTEVMLNWEGGDNSDGFLLEQSIEGGEFEIVGFVPAGAREFLVKNLIPGEQVSFRASAVGGQADTTASNEESATPQLGTEGAVILEFRNNNPGSSNTIPYQIIVKNSTSESIPLSELTLRYWMDYDNERAIVSELYYCTTSGVSGRNISGDINTTATPAAQEQIGATHFIDFTFEADAPVLPAGASTNPGTLSMQGNLRKDYSGSTQLVPGNDFSHFPVTSLTVHNRMNILRNGELIFGVTPGGGSGGANSPLAPTALRAVGMSESSIELTWQDVADNEVLYVIERDFLEEPGSFKILTTVTSNSIIFNDADLLDEAEYRYRIRAVNADGVSSATNVASARTLEGVSPQFIPATPENFAVTAFSDRRLDLTWSDASRNEKGFIIERQADGGGYIEIARVNPGTTSFVDYGLDPATSYTYRITSFNLAGNGMADPSAGATSVTQPPSPPTDEEIMRFLRQATFGATPNGALVAEVRAKGYEQWLDDQFDTALTPITHHAPTLAPGQWTQDDRVEAWWAAVLGGPDQVRQRLAFALSQILVISQNDGDLADQAYAMALFYDMLVDAPESNYRELLEDVTFSPVMGKYLDHTRNQKSNGLVRPDENYAREIMQLFSIGLVRLNLDGTPMLDEAGVPLPTYNQRDIEQVARVFTGLSFAGSTDFLGGADNFLEPMIMFPDFHETGSKDFVLLNSDIPDIAGGGDPLDDLEKMHDGLAGHTSTAPFISRQLIQRTVTSNPSPAYIERVATVFQTTNGDLKETFKAVLLDYEARSNDPLDSLTYGKQREPLIRIANLLRMLAVSPGGNGYDIGNLTDVVQQSPLQAPTVFNFFEPDFSLPGEITRAGLASPEFQTTQSSTVIESANYFNDLIFGSVTSSLLDFSRYTDIASDTSALLDQLDMDFLDGRMPDAMRLVITDFVSGISSAETKAKSALYLVVTSAEFTIEQ